MSGRTGGGMDNSIRRQVFLLQVIFQGILMLMSANLTAQEPLLTFDFEGITGPSLLHGNLMASEVTVSEGSIQFQAGADQQGTTIGYATSWNQEGFSTAGKYLEFSLTPQPGYQIVLSGLSFRFGRTLSGPQRVTIQYSLSDFVLRGLPLLENAPVGSLSVNDLDDFQVPVAHLPPDALTSKITFRIWGHDATGSGNLRFNDFECFGTVTQTSDCDPTALYFRSRQHGSWHDVNSWESSPGGSGPWTIAGCIPDSRAEAIVIQSPHSIILSQSVGINQLTIKGILEAGYGSEIIMMPPAGEAMVIDEGGVLLFNGGDVPVFQDPSLRVRVKTGGAVQVDHSLTQMSQKLAGNESAGHFSYEHGGIFHWNTSHPFSSKDQVYFPEAPQEVIPIFRISQSLGFVGAGTATRINGLLDAQASVTWQYAGSKTFRNGIIGPGKVRQNNSDSYFYCGPLFITGDTALLGGPGILEMNTNGLTITAKHTTVVSDKSFVGGPVVLAGQLDAAHHTVSFAGNLFMTSQATWIANHSTLVFNGLAEQQLVADCPLRLFNLSVVNLQGLKVSRPMGISSQLLMAGGNINMQGHLLEIGISPLEPGMLIHLSGTILGPVCRWFNNHTNTGQSGLFPVGTALSHNPVVIDFTTAPVAGSITGRFIDSHHLPDNYYGNLPFTAGDLFLNVLADYGFWQLDAANGLVPGIFTLALDASGFPGIYVPENIRILSRESLSNDWHLEGQPIDYSGNMVFSGGAMSTLSQFALAGHNKENPLPVELLSFTAHRSNNKVELRWSTASEINNALFTLERCTHSRIPEAIGWVAGGGYSSHILNYLFVDQDPPQQPCFYRLKQTDHDGNQKYSPWIAVEQQPIAGTLQVTVCQEHDTGWLQVISTLYGSVEVILSDAMGRIFSRNTYETNPGIPDLQIPITPGSRQMILYRVDNGRDVVRGKVIW